LYMGEALDCAEFKTCVKLPISGASFAIASDTELVYPPYLPPPCFISLGVSQGEFTVPFIVFIVLIGHELDKDGVVFRLWWQRRGGKWKKWNFLGVWLSKNSTLSTTYSGTHTSSGWKIRHFLGQYPCLSP
jgi:hypothetical protein